MIETALIIGLICLTITQLFRLTAKVAKLEAIFKIICNHLNIKLDCEEEKKEKEER